MRKALSARQYGVLGSQREGVLGGGVSVSSVLSYLVGPITQCEEHMGLR